MGKENIILIILLIIIILAVGVALYCSKSACENDNMCEKYFGFEQSTINEVSNAWYQNINEKYYNCCYYDIINTSNYGYKKEMVCVGFIKDNKY